MPSTASSVVWSVDDLPDFVALLERQLDAAGPPTGEAPSAPSALGAGEIVLMARELSGLSQRQMAAGSGSSQPSIARIESGSRLPNVGTLMRVAEAAGLELIVGLRRPGSRQPIALGALLRCDDDDLADFHPIVTPSAFEGPLDR